MNKKEFDKIIEAQKEPMVRMLQEWIRIPSLKSDPEPGAPFGRELRRMLDKVLSDCESLGFAVNDIDGYAGDAKMGEGADEDALGILAHIDVVPAGDGWHRDPFGAQLEGDLLFGRGTSDDKGPLAAALFAMKAVKDAGIPLKRKVTLIFGCDEESGMEDMKYYKENAVMPKSGFSPDGSYPLINLEKGSCTLHLSAEAARDGLKVLELKVGERQNVIPGAATALVEGDASFIEKVEAVSEKYGWPVEAMMEGEAVRIRAIGMNGHAAYPESARNAIGQLLITLKELGVTGPLATLAEKIGTQYYGEGLGIAVRDEASGPLTCNMGIIRLEEGRLFATLDIRAPLLAAGERLHGIVQAHLPGIKVTQVSLKPPHYVPESSELVQKLLDAYHEVTGRGRATLSTGGGTYARMLQQGVAFGASFPEDPDVAHQANEYIIISKLMQSVKIFAYAIIKLAGEEGALQ
ncbi:MAG: Sapep family Mn(2+)-dependent dipeptidase [Bacillota bacterium]|nr:Sapep family Mn(2+)-dependent dipeptidase [Bacillota bacterium]